MNETQALLSEISAEIDTLLTRHRSASNEVCAAIAREAYDEATSFAGIPHVDADAHFSKHFPTLSLYL